MIAVIFKARIKALDADYSDTAARLRDLAMSQYGCTEFIACNEGDLEIAVSYWRSEDDILAWKQDALHREAQGKGKDRWYSSYTVQVAEVTREYSA